MRIMMILLLLILIKCCDKSTWQESSGTHWSPCRQEGEGNILSKRMLETFNIEGWVGWVWLDIGMVAGWGEALATVNSGSTLKTFDFESAISTEKTWILDKRLTKGYISSQPGRKWEIMIWWTLSHWRTQAPLLVSEHLPWLPAGTSMFSYFWDDPSRIPLSEAPIESHLFNFTFNGRADLDVITIDIYMHDWWMMGRTWSYWSFAHMVWLKLGAHWHWAHWA